MCTGQETRGREGCPTVGVDGPEATDFRPSRETGPARLQAVSYLIPQPSDPNPTAHQPYDGHEQHPHGGRQNAIGHVGQHCPRACHAGVQALEAQGSGGLSSGGAACVQGTLTPHGDDM